MNITKNFTTLTQTYFINLHEFQLGEITVQRYKLDSVSDWTEPKINWAGCGAVSLHKVEQFELGLGVAKHLADCLKQGIDSTSIRIEG
jgi:hypothetical protein